MIMLTRVVPPAAVTPLDLPVVQDAARVFGYTPTVPVTRPLLDILLALDIVPFDVAQIDRYKGREQRRKNLPWACIPWSLAAALAGVSFYIPDFGLAIATRVVAGGIGLFGIGTWQLAEFWRWRLFGLGSNTQHTRSYQEPVPAFVLATALKIRKQASWAHFEVEALVRADREHFMADPFLVVTYGAERYYIEVWNEPRFSETRHA